MNPIRYQPGATYDEQLRIWANGNEDEHRPAVFLEERVSRHSEAAMDSIRQEAYDDGYSEGNSDGYSEGFDEGYAEAKAAYEP